MNHRGNNALINKELHHLKSHQLGNRNLAKLRYMVLGLHFHQDNSDQPGIHHQYSNHFARDNKILQPLYMGSLVWKSPSKKIQEDMGCQHHRQNNKSLARLGNLQEERYSLHKICHLCILERHPWTNFQQGNTTLLVQYILFSNESNMHPCPQSWPCLCNGSFDKDIFVDLDSDSCHCHTQKTGNMDHSNNQLDMVLKCTALR